MNSPDFVLTTADDTLHVPDTDHQWWSEGTWFGFFIPERKLAAYLYSMFRVNLGVQAGGIFVWDDQAALPWEIRYQQWHWHLAIPADVDLRDARLDTGMWIRCLEPASVYEFGYRRGDFDVSCRFDAIGPALVTVPGGKPPFKGAWHVDQPGRVTGTMRLDGETLDIDCYVMRDRSWGVRSDLKGVQAGYEYAIASPDDAFLALSLEIGGEHRVVTGFLQRDGRRARLVDGLRTVTRDERGLAVTASVDATDELGRSVHATGRAENWHVTQPYPSMFLWASMARWDMDGIDCWGEIQDAWHPDRWRAFAAAMRSERRTAT